MISQCHSQIPDSGPRLRSMPLMEATILEVMRVYPVIPLGVGHGVALPHARVPGIDKVYAAFIRLQDPNDYESIDDRPVDLVAMIIAPEDAGGSHLRALAQLSRLLRREHVRQRLRMAPDVQSLYISLSDD